MVWYRCLSKLVHRLDNTAEVLDVPRALTVLCYSQVTGVYRRTDSINNVQQELPLLWPVYTHCNIKAHPPPYEYTFVILQLFSDNYFLLWFSDYLFFRKWFKCIFAGLHFGSWVFAKQETLKVAHSGLNQLQFCFLIIFSIYPMFLSLQVRTLYFLVNFSSQILSFSFSS